MQNHSLIHFWARARWKYAAAFCHHRFSLLNGTHVPSLAFVSALTFYEHVLAMLLLGAHAWHTFGSTLSQVHKVLPPRFRRHI